MQDLRYERKFLVTGLLPFQIELIVKMNQAGFSPVFRPRSVNSIYFDTLSGASLADNLDGVADRTKVRVRWYGDLSGYAEHPVLEFKFKRGLAGWKERFPLTGIPVGRGLCRADLRGAIERSTLPDWARHRLLGMDPVLICRYSRKYFQAFAAPLRASIDTGITYYRFQEYSTNLMFSSADKISTVVELKYPPEWDSDMSTVSNQFPFRMTKNSKYVSGLEHLFGRV